MGECVWVVMSADGIPLYVAAYPEACHEHINYCINEHQVDEAKNWVVRMAVLEGKK